MTTGLDGTPMPSFADSMSEADRWAISYYVLSFSAFNDPLTGAKLRLDPAIQARLVTVYAILGVWGIYYLVRYWGGLGPGLAR